MKIARYIEIPDDREAGIAMQEKHAQEIEISPIIDENIRIIAGVDGSYPPKTNRGYVGIVVIDRDSKEVIEEATWIGDVTFPYIPGLLSLREVPAMISAFKKLKTVPDLVIVDGNGQIHPRRFGLASHIGWCLDIPTIGCAKTPFIGEYDQLSNERGAIVDLTDNGQVIGKVVRAQVDSQPIFISVGHKADLETGTQIAFSLTSKSNRHPFPVFKAHHLCSRIRKQEKENQ